MKTSSPAGAREIFRKLGFYGALGLLAIYILGVTAGYCWLHFARKNEGVSLIDVALFRIGAIRHDIATQHFAKAQVEWDAKNVQSAYLFFSAGVRQDPDNILGRLKAVSFLRSVGAGNMALIMLEEGLARAPTDGRLIQQTFEQLLTAGRNRRVLELLKEKYGTGLSGKDGVLLELYEVEATVAADGAPAAQKLLGKYPALLHEPVASRTVAQIFWESKERLRAIDVLQDYLRTDAGVFGDYAQLASWQEATGETSDAVQTARRATAKFPSALPPRVLLIEMLAADAPARTTLQYAIIDFLHDFGTRPEALQELSMLAGKKGWVELSRNIYQVAANQQRDLNIFAFAYSDALVRVARFNDAREVLTELEVQSADASVPFMVQLRQRQIIVAAARGDSDNVREYARRLGSVLSRDPDGLEACRRIFSKLGIAGAVAELSSRSLVASAGAKN